MQVFDVEAVVEGHLRMHYIGGQFHCAGAM